jgi:hypothetical protein
VAVRDTALAAMQRALDVHALTHTVPLLELLQARLNAAAAGGAALDGARTAFVVLTGGVARHLPPSDERVQRALHAMVDTLRTPSESVQRSVSAALARLVRPLRVRTDNTAVQSLADEVSSRWCARTTMASDAAARLASPVWCVALARAR